MIPSDPQETNDSSHYRFSVNLFIVEVSTLFVVATPIGNLSDISARALETLRSVGSDRVRGHPAFAQAAQSFGIQKPLESYHDFNESEKAEMLAMRIEKGLSVALISDAGLPPCPIRVTGWYEPAGKKGIAVVAIPGPPLRSQHFPLRACRRTSSCLWVFFRLRTRRAWKNLKLLKPVRATLIIYESPHRIEETLRQS